MHQIIDGLLYVSGRRATQREFSEWAAKRAEENRLVNEAKPRPALPPMAAPRRRAAGPVAQFDPETGVMLQEGDPGYNPHVSQPLPSSGALFDPLMVGEERASAIRRAQATDLVKAKEAMRHRRLVAAAKGDAIPAAIDAGYKPVGGVEDPLAYMAAREEREELEAIERREAALDALRKPGALARFADAADPGRPRPMFAWQSQP